MTRLRLRVRRPQTRKRLLIKGIGQRLASSFGLRIALALAAGNVSILAMVLNTQSLVVRKESRTKAHCNKPHVRSLIVKSPAVKSPLRSKADPANSSPLTNEMHMFFLNWNFFSDFVKKKIFGVYVATASLLPWFLLFCKIRFISKKQHLLNIQQHSVNVSK